MTWFPGELRARARQPVRAVFLVCLLPAILAAHGCTAGDAMPAAAAADVPFEVEVNPAAVTVFNRSSRPLSDIRITIVPAGSLRFTYNYSRLEPRARRAFNVGDFRARDNSPLNMRVVKPQSVQVVAKDDEGVEHQLQVPWPR